MNYDAQLERLTRLPGSDAGIYLLALHAFLEYYLKESFREIYPQESFFQYLNDYRQHREYTGNGGFSREEAKLYSRLKDERHLTNGVRHHFETVPVQYATSATSNFISFCTYHGIESEALKKLNESLELWNKRSSHYEDYRALMDEKWAHHQSKRKLKEIVASVDQYQAEEKETARLSRLLAVKEEELSQLNEKVESQRERMDEIRKERGMYRLELDQIRKSLGKKEDVRAYIEYLRRATYYTRTRLDYEQSLLRLTPEQERVLQQIKFDNDFLIKGGAGTGKTLVLLEALKRAQGRQKESLGLEDAESFLLLTYTRTLVKYNKYVSELMKIDADGTSISTVDSLLWKEMKLLEIDYRIDYRVLQELIKDLDLPEFISARELHTEIETLIYGNIFSEVEYIDEMIPRSGMRRPLRQEQRRTVWKLKEELEERMFSQGLVSKGLACRLILSALQATSTPAHTDYIFVDEAQDLNPVQLAIFKLRTRRALILAGDTDQSIYGIGSPYKRAGINIQGVTHILRTNFRNTTPIHTLAEAFRCSNSSSPHDIETEPAAFRAGPVPECFTSDEMDDLYAQLLDKMRLFIHTLEYDPENIAVIAPDNIFLKKIAGKLKEAGIPSEQVKNDSFTFSSTGKVRLAPLHSSKGLDFPVVMCFLPLLHSDESLDEKSQLILHRNQIYVALTRAMENLNVFCKAVPQEEALKNLLGIFSETFGQ